MRWRRSIRSATRCARSRACGPRSWSINGGDGTVQATLTELYHGDHFGTTPPPVAVLPNGKTNLIALDLGAVGDPLVALERIMEIARTDLAPHIVARELIALSHGEEKNVRPVLGMFLGGAGLADSMLYCRNKIYPLGLPNTISHVLTAIAILFTMIFGIRAHFLPPRPKPVSVSVLKQGVRDRHLRAADRDDAAPAAARAGGRRRATRSASSS